MKGKWNAEGTTMDSSPITSSPTRGALVMVHFSLLPYLLG